MKPITGQAKGVPVGFDSPSMSQPAFRQAQAFIAVPTKFRAAILEEGYRCTRRVAVPCQFGERADAVEAFMNMHKDQDISVLEVHGVDDCLFERDEHGPGGIIKLKHLPADNLSDGAAFTRVEHGDGTTMPCPFCGNNLEVPDEDRRKVGLAKYRCDDADGTSYYVGSQCWSDQWKSRQQRLNQGRTWTGYHQTSRRVADLIYGTGKMIRGRAGNAGGGIYFAETKRETEWKAVPETVSGPGSDRVLLECEVKLGNIRHEYHQSQTPLLPELQSITFANMMNFEGNTVETVEDDNVTKTIHTNAPGPKDSVFLKRGMSSFGKSGDEVIVYSWDQVKVLREVPRDPV